MRSGRAFRTGGPALHGSYMPCVSYISLTKMVIVESVVVSIIAQDILPHAILTFYVSSIEHRVLPAVEQFLGIEI